LPGVGAILISIVLVLPGYILSVGVGLALKVCRIENKRNMAPLNALLIYIFLSFALNTAAALALGHWSRLSLTRASYAAAALIMAPRESTAIIAGALRTLEGQALLYAVWLLLVSAGLTALIMLLITAPVLAARCARAAAKRARPMLRRLASALRFRLKAAHSDPHRVQRRRANPP
jgi:hypothetical protein